MIAQHTNPLKSIQFLHPYFEDKQVNVRIQVSACLQTIVNKIGPVNVGQLPKLNQQQLFSMLAYYVQDSSQDVRINGK